MSLSPHVLPLKKLYLDLEDHSVINFSHPHEFLHAIILFYAITHAFKFNYYFLREQYQLLNAEVYLFLHRRQSPRYSVNNKSHLYGYYIVNCNTFNQQQSSMMDVFTKARVFPK